MRLRMGKPPAPPVPTLAERSLHAVPLQRRKALISPSESNYTNSTGVLSPAPAIKPLHCSPI